jgi:hypothetical protein
VEGQFLPKLEQTGIIQDLFSYLLKATIVSDAKEKQLNPIQWLEAKVTNMRASALENCRVLEKPLTVQCRVSK